MNKNWTVYSAAELNRLAIKWDALNRKCGNIPFFETGFLLALIKEFPAFDLHLAIACDSAGEWIAATLIQPQGRGQWTTYQPSQLPLGAWLQAPTQGGDELARALLHKVPTFALRLGLTQLDPWICRRPAAGTRTSSIDYITTAWVNVNGTFGDYWEGRGKNLRTNLRKQRSKLQADGIAIQFERITNPQMVDAAIVEYGQLEAVGWKASNGTAVHSDNAQGRFYQAMLRHFCSLGRGEIWRLRFNEKIVAMDLCISAGNTLVILKTAFDSSYQTISPAFLLKQEAFQKLFDEGYVRRIEFYGRQMDWHTRWTTESRVLYHANFDRWAWVGKLQRVLNRLTKKTPALLKIADSHS